MLQNLWHTVIFGHQLKNKQLLSNASLSRRAEGVGKPPDNHYIVCGYEDFVIN